MALAFLIITARLLRRFGGCLPVAWRFQLYARAPRFREPDRDRLLRRSRTMFPLPNVMHFFPNEFSRL
jgi:hypothetical protein